MSQKPTQHEIKAVQAVLYKPSRVQQISELTNNISVLMNLDPTTPLPNKDVRNPAGSGPQWYLPGTGGLDSLVTQAAGYCDKLAEALQTIHQEIAKVSFPPADKDQLLIALSESAMAWRTRAKLWRDPNAPADPKTAAASIAAHLTASMAASAHLKPYLKSSEDIGLE